jgi:hypothetical protein
VKTDPVAQSVLREKGQDHETRKSLFRSLERSLGRPVVSFFTSFNFPVAIEDADADMLEGVLQKLDLSKGLALVISSPGGDGLAAERIVNVCRSHSGTGEFWAIVPGKAKSAATMICFGASKIFMGPTSELGPVDPQMTVRDASGVKRFSVYNVIQSYRDLFQQAVKEQGRLEPYLQQLNNYDAREIREMESAMALAGDIAVRNLASGMMKGCDPDEIRKRIEMFLVPDKVVKVHGRPIYRDQAHECGIDVEVCETKSPRWINIYELYIRSSMYVTDTVAKCMESKHHSFVARKP